MKYYDDTTGWDLWTLHPNTTYSTNQYIDTMTNAFRKTTEAMKKFSAALLPARGTREWHRANHLAVTAREFLTPSPVSYAVAAGQPVVRKRPVPRGHTGWVRRGSRRPL
jgi:hypothetical protein